MIQPLVLKQFQIKVVLPFLFKFVVILYRFCRQIYLNPTLACQTKANKKKRTGITGITSASGPNTAKTPGNLLSKIVSI